MSNEATLERHYDLWKEESASVGRWVFGTLLFAAIVLLRVIEPYIETSQTLAQDQDRLAAHAASQSEEKATLKKTERLAKGVTRLYQGISQSPLRHSPGLPIIQAQDGRIPDRGSRV